MATQIIDISEEIKMNRGRFKNTTETILDNQIGRVSLKAREDEGFFSSGEWESNTIVMKGGYDSISLKYTVSNKNLVRIFIKHSDNGVNWDLIQVQNSEEDIVMTSKFVRILVKLKGLPAKTSSTFGHMKYDSIHTEYLSEDLIDLSDDIVKRKVATIQESDRSGTRNYSYGEIFDPVQMKVEHTYPKGHVYSTELSKSDFLSIDGFS